VIGGVANHPSRGKNTIDNIIDKIKDSIHDHVNDNVYDIFGWLVRID